MNKAATLISRIEDEQSADTNQPVSLTYACHGQFQRYACLIYDGIYRDDGIAVLKGSKTTGELANWLSTHL
jgi:hypothetical protein